LEIADLEALIVERLRPRHGRAALRSLLISVHQIWRRESFRGLAPREGCTFPGVVFLGSGNRAERQL